ncbi:MAG: sulfite exporter TauE/SafE family protein [Armatimonadetes bacterium]|nr:sulfite exporter TauE/SafE family protein [Armatimonadota bacterium]
MLLPYAVPALVVFGAAVVQGVTGFAFGIVSMVFLTLLWQPQQANVVVSLLAMYSICHAAWGVKHAIRWRQLGPLMAGNLLGLWISVQVLVSHDLADLLRYLVAIACLLVALQNWLVREHPAASPRGNGVLGLVAGTLAGFLSGATSTSGPPTVWWIYRQPWSRDELKANTLAVFLLTGIAKLGLWIVHDLRAAPAAHLLAPARCVTAVGLLPAVMLGSLCGVAVFRRVDRDQLRRAVCALLVVMAAVIVVTTLRHGR